MGRWTGTLLSRAAQRLREDFEARLSDLELKSKHYGILIALRDGPLTQVELGRALWIDRTTMVSMIDELARLELVERAAHPEDRRAHAVTLTAKGIEVERAATKAADEVEAEFFATLSEKERATLRELLDKITEEAKKDEG